jgi:hypothetical protein
MQCLHLVQQVAGDDECPRLAGGGVGSDRPTPDQADEVVPGHGIEPVEGLVKHEQIRAMRHGAGQLCPLSHPLGESGQWPIHGLAQPHAVEFPIRPLGRGTWPEAGEPDEIPHPLTRRRPPFEEVGGRAEPDPSQHPRVGKGPVMSPRSVVLPAPLGPSRPWAPLPNSTVTSLTPITDPKTFVTCVSESMGVSDARLWLKIKPKHHPGQNTLWHQALVGASILLKSTSTAPIDTTARDTSDGMTARGLVSMPKIQACTTPSA